MNELGYYDATGDGRTAGLDDDHGHPRRRRHPYAAAWWPDGHVLGYEHGFINQAADILTMIGGGTPVVPMPDFADAFKTQRVLEAAIESARTHQPVTITRRSPSVRSQPCRASTIRARLHVGRRPHRRPPGADAPRSPGSRPRSRRRGMARLRQCRRSRLHRTVGGDPSRPVGHPGRSDARPGRQHPRPAPPFDKDRAARVLAAVQATGVEIADVAYFDNMLHDDPAIRQQKVDFMMSTMDAAELLGVHAVCGFVGRDQTKSMDQNLIEFENTFVPLLKSAKDRGLQYRVEQCPMPGWTPGDNFHNNIGYTPGTWIALHQICERNGVGDQFRIHYDPSHAILMGQDTRSIFQYLKDEGYDFLIAGMHVKGQVVDSKGVAGWGMAARPSTAVTGSTARCRPTRQTWPTRGRSRRCCANTSCRAPPATTRSPTCRTGVSTGSITNWRPASCSTWTSPPRP